MKKNVTEYFCSLEKRHNIKTNINPKIFINLSFSTRKRNRTKWRRIKSCQGLANKEECLNTLKDFQNNKTLGNDGLPTEFYLFGPDICHDLLASYNFACQHGMLSISQRWGIHAISLIPKQSKDQTILENLRPISLLKVNYKILTKVIAKRKENVLPTCTSIKLVMLKAPYSTLVKKYKANLWLNTLQG